MRGGGVCLIYCRTSNLVLWNGRGLWITARGIRTTQGIAHDLLRTWRGAVVASSTSKTVVNSWYAGGGSGDAKMTFEKISALYKGRTWNWCKTTTMNYIKIAGIKHGEETDLQDILRRRGDIMREFKAAVNSCETYKTSLPVNLFKKGNVLLSNPQDTRALMVFLRAAARLEGAAILLRKRGIVRNGRQTTQSLYKLLM